MGYTQDDIADGIAQEDGAFAIHSPADGVGDRVLAALTFRSRGNLVTRDILSSDQSTVVALLLRQTHAHSVAIGVYLQGSAQRFSNLIELVGHYAHRPQSDLNVPNLRLPTQ